MNSKERAGIAFKRGIPDRCPLGFFAINSDTAAKVLGRPTYWRAKAKCQIAFWEGRRDEVVQSWIEDGVELYKKLDIIDIIPVSNHMAGICPPKNYRPVPPKKIADDTWEDSSGKIYKYSPLTADITMIHDPQGWTREYKVEEELWDGTVTPPDASVFEAVDAFIAAFKDDRFIIGPSAPAEGWLLLGGMERGFLEIASEPDAVKAIYASRIDRAIAENSYYIRPGQDGVLDGTDYSSSQGPMISPQCYRDLFLPAYQKRIRNFKEQHGKIVVQHACGNNWPLMDIFVEMGIDCYQSIQASAGMDMIEVQKKYGDRLSLWGGVQLEHLVSGTTEDVRRDVRRVMQEAAPSGGIILGTSHSVAVGTKYDNFMALLDEYSKFI